MLMIRVCKYLEMIEGSLGMIVNFLIGKITSCVIDLFAVFVEQVTKK